MSSFELIADNVGEIPCLFLSPRKPASESDFVLVLHGLGSQKEKMLPIMYALAMSGFRAVAIDARQHGERSDSSERDSRLAGSYVQTMFDIISGTTVDISTLLDHLKADRVGIHGISLGGYIIFAALLSEPRLAVASIAMGSPDWLGPLRDMGIDTDQPGFAALASVNPLDRAEFSYSPRPVLMLHGSEDAVVSPAGAQILYDRLKPTYRDAPDRVELVIYPGLGHQYIDDMQQRSIAWLARFLQPQRAHGNFHLDGLVQ